MNSEVRVAQKAVKQYLKITKVMERKSNNCWKVINLKIPLESMTVWSFHTECVLKKQNLPLNCFLNLRNIPVGGKKRDKGFSFTSNGLRELAQLKFAATHVRDVVCKGQSLRDEVEIFSAALLQAVLKRWDHCWRYVLWRPPLSSDCRTTFISICQNVLFNSRYVLFNDCIIELEKKKIHKGVYWKILLLMHWFRYLHVYYLERMVRAFGCKVCQFV